jgi:hypothetical protein
MLKKTQKGILLKFKTNVEDEFDYLDAEEIAEMYSDNTIQAYAVEQNVKRLKGCGTKKLLQLFPELHTFLKERQNDYEDRREDKDVEDAYNRKIAGYNLRHHVIILLFLELTCFIEQRYKIFTWQIYWIHYEI